MSSTAVKDSSTKTGFVYPATLLCDFYKISHREQYPAGTEKVYSTWTASLIDHVITTDSIIGRNDFPDRLTILSINQFRK